MTETIRTYKYNGARTLVLLHEIHLQSLFRTWTKAKALNIVLPETDDPDYQSLDALLRHVFRAARGYLTWICEQLYLENPDINAVPQADHIAAEAESYLPYLLEKWRLPLAEISEDRFFDKTYKSRWGAHYCIEAMLEHAVMHPIRHQFQLENLLNS
jgi:uncharacterized damage-inducible protein DinB